MAPTKKMAISSLIDPQPARGERLRLIELSPEIWYLIFEQLGRQDRQDLRRFSLVSKSFSSLIKPLLYRSISLWPGRSVNWYLRSERRDYRFSHLLLRLLDPSNIRLRALVREVTFGTIILDGEDARTVEILKKENLLVTLVNSLPNLQSFTLQSSTSLSGEFVYSLENHPCLPKLHILAEDGTSAFPSEIRCASTLHASIDPTFERQLENKPNRRIFNIQRLLFACPNLRTFSLTLRRRYGGCMPSIPRFPIHRNFRVQEADKFPPIEDLSFNGYRPDIVEWVHWRDRFCWQNLTSLTLGPDGDHYVLRLIKGHVTALRRLKLTAWLGRGVNNCEELQDFLLSFNTLESLEVKGYSFPVYAIGNHPNLTRLCLHTIETDKPERPRRVLTIEDIERIDMYCPNITDLELDIQRGDGKWPKDIFRTLARRFSNLRHLSCHFELGVSNHSMPIQPVLNYASAQELGRLFFEQRGLMIVRKPTLSTISLTGGGGGGGEESPAVKLQTLTLKTGESLRKFPEWPPRFSQWEKNHTMTFELRPPMDPTGSLTFKHLEREEYEALTRSDIEPNLLTAALLRKVESAVLGPRKQAFLNFSSSYPMGERLNHTVFISQE